MGTEGSAGHRLAGVIEKFNRGKEQFDQLLAETNAFFNKEPKPHFSRGEFDTDAWEWVERLQVREEPPLRFGILLGDVLHNLRSALDHLMWQVTLLDGGAPNGDTQFPIVAEGQREFDGQAKRRIPDLSPEHRAFVKSLQPYHAGKKARLHPLAVLNKLSNIDKHQVVHATYSFIDADPADVTETIDRLMRERGRGSPVRGFFLAKPGQALHHGTPWFRIVWDRGEEPPGEVQVSANLSLGIAFSELGIKAEDIKRLGGTVLTIIQRLQADFPETVFIER